MKREGTRDCGTLTWGYTGERDRSTKLIHVPRRRGLRISDHFPSDPPLGPSREDPSVGVELEVEGKEVRYLCLNSYIGGFWIPSRFGRPGRGDGKGPHSGSEG